MVYCETFGYKTSMKTLEDVADQTGEMQIYPFLKKNNNR